MIDSIRLRFPLETPVSQSTRTELLIEDSRNRRSKKNIFNEERYQIILPFNKDSAWISVQSSLPRFLNGSNVKPLSLEETVRAIHELLNQVAKDLKLAYIPVFSDIGVVRADIVFDWIVDSPEAYLSVIDRFAMVRGNHNLDTHKNGLDKGTTVKSGSSRQSLMAYNKEAQVYKASKTRILEPDEFELASGRLRAELRLAGRGWQPYLHDPSPSLKQVLEFLQANGRKALSQKWERFTDGWDVCPLEDAVVKLSVAYGAKRGRKLAEMFSLVRGLGVEKYRLICKPDDSTWSRFRRALREAGVSLTDAGGLKRLTISWFDPKQGSRIYSSLLYTKQLAAEPCEDEFEADDDGNLWEILVGIPVKFVHWEEAA